MQRKPGVKMFFSFSDMMSLTQNSLHNFVKTDQNAKQLCTKFFHKIKKKKP